MSVTVHSIVVNEDQFVRFALMSVLPFVDKIFIYDTGSTDKTEDIINSINSDKIIFEEKGSVLPVDLVRLRQEMISRTKTDFFMLLDGDEIWSEKNIKKFLADLKNMPKEKIAVYCRTRNAVGDVFHYLPENAGRYRFHGKTGHFAMRGFRNVPDLTVGGIYPLETYSFKGRSLNNWEEKLYFSDTWYLHTTHLRRSSSPEKVPGFRSRKMETGLAFKEGELPEVFLRDLPPKRSLLYEIIAGFLTPLKKVRRASAKI